jgi:putative ABC transport system permease protein
MVVAELALALVLLVGSGLLIHSLLRLQHVNPGFDTENLLTMRVRLPTLENLPEQQTVIYQEILSRLENLPGVKAAALTSSLPFAGSFSWTAAFKIDGQPIEPGREPLAGWRFVSPTYFQTMGIPLRAGRTFTSVDTASSMGVIIINESFARLYFPSGDPIGKTIIASWNRERPRQVVGVISDFKHKGLASDIAPEMYVPNTQQTWASMAVVVRTNVEPERLQVPIQKAIWGVNPLAPISRVKTMNSILDEQVSHSRFTTLLLGIFSALALILASIGIYGVMSYAVSLRRHELGVRKALGAQKIDLIRLIVSQGMKLALLGVVLGVAGAFGLTRLLATLLYGISPTDPLTFSGVVLLVLIVTFLACWIPAHRAAKVNPIIALRCE